VPTAVTRAVNFVGDFGRQALILDNDDVVRLLRAEIEREGSQAAFARRRGVERTRINAILSGKRRLTEAVVNALGLRTTFTPK
jgi:hypothetical protein